MRSYEPELPGHHGYGPLITNNGEFSKPRSKRVRDRIRRWAKRVLKRKEAIRLQDD